MTEPAIGSPSLVPSSVSPSDTAVGASAPDRVVGASAEQAAAVGAGPVSAPRDAPAERVERRAALRELAAMIGVEVFY